MTDRSIKKVDMSPRTPEQFEQVRARSKEKIVLAALTLFAEKGFFNTSVQEIARQAGVAKGLIYNYFEKKEDLLKGIVEHAMDEGEAIMGKIDQFPTASEKLAYMINYAIDFIQQRVEYNKLLVSLSLQLDHFPHIREIILAKYEGMFPLLEPLLAEQGKENPHAEAMELGAMLDGIGLQYIVIGEKYPIEAMRTHLLNRFTQ